jgi:SAM-dependent methyltransferase
MRDRTEIPGQSQRGLLDVPPRKDMKPARLSPRFWRRDAYVLSKLAHCVAAIADRFHDGSLIGPLLKGDKVVDFGAGAAPYRDLFNRPGINYIVCDLDASSEVVITPGEPVPLGDHSARLVVSFQVLEHVWDLDWYLSEVRRLLTPDGVVVLSTHGTWLYHPHPTDYRRWTRDGLALELTTRGFVLQEITGLVGPLAWTTQFRALGFHRMLSAIPLLGSLLAALVGSVMNLRMLIEDRLTPVAWTDTNAAVYVLVARKDDKRPQ